MSLLLINGVYEIEDCRMRLLWHDQNFTYAYLIDIDHESPVVKMNIPEILSKAKSIEDNYAISTDVTHIDSNHIERMEKRWSVIADIVSNEPYIYIKRHKNDMIRRLVKNGYAYRSITRDLYQYWQRGMSKYSLLPDYSKCGTVKPITNYNKPGRKKLFHEKFGNGIVVDESLINLFKGYYKSYMSNADKSSLKKEYIKMIAEHFRSNPNKPSYQQFLYRYNKIYGLKDKLFAIKGGKKYMKDHRPIFNNSMHNVMGPGSLFQIDATIADFALVSTFNRKILVGRPVLYFVIDVYTRVLTGFHVGVHSASGDSAMLAILNCIENKVDYCKKHNIDIETKDWPSMHLPARLLCDNGEMKSRRMENLTKTDVRLQFHGSYRGDMKGIVERSFRSFHDETKHILPGHVSKDYKERGVRDYKKDALLTLDEFTKIIIHFIIYHNKKVMRYYPFNDGFAETGKLHTPIDIWEWGVINKPGGLRPSNYSTLKPLLLNKKDCSITPKGIQLHKDLFYMFKDNFELELFLRNTGKKYKKIELSYNPKNLYEAYVLHNNEYIPVIPTPSSNAAKYNILDYEAYITYLKLVVEQRVNHESEIYWEYFSNVDFIVKNAKANASLEYGPQAVNIKNLRKSRSVENYSTSTDTAFDFNNPGLTEVNDVGVTELSNSQDVTMIQVTNDDQILDDKPTASKSTFVDQLRNRVNKNKGTKDTRDDKYDK